MTIVPTQLTANPIELSVTGAAISPEADYLAYADPEGLHLQTLPAGDPHLVRIDRPLRPWKVWWYPDGKTLLLLAKEGDKNLGLWTLGMLGGRAVKIQDSVMTAAISPDGKHLAFIKGSDTRAKMLREIWLAGPEGQKPHLLLTAGPEESFWKLVWSPDSKRLAYGVWENFISPGEPWIVIKTCDLNGENQTELYSGTELFQNWTGPLPFVWCPDGRLILAKHERLEEDWDIQTSNLWIVETDVPRGAIRGDPKRLTQWLSANVRGLTVSEDGKTLVAFLVRNQADILLGKLDPSRRALVEEVRLTVNEKEDWTPSWRPDSKALTFMSSRSGNFDLYTTGLDLSRPRSLLNSPAREEAPKYSPDGKWVVFLSSGSVMRVASDGGVPEAIVEGKRFDRLDCVSEEGKGVQCLAGYIERDEYVYHSIAPDMEGSQELFRISHRPPFTNWALSPDGEEIAVVHNDDNTIRLFSIASGEQSEIEVKGWTNFENVEWSADGRNLYLNAGFAVIGQFPSLIVVDLEGNAQMLRERPFEWHVHQAASPDGEYLAFVSMPFHGNAWLVKDF